MDPTSTNAWSTMRAKGPTICILGATFSTNNMGVSALAVGALRVCFVDFPMRACFCLDYAKNPGIEHFHLGDRCIPITFVNMRFSKKLYLANNIAVLLLISLALKFVPFRKLRGRLGPAPTDHYSGFKMRISSFPSLVETVLAILMVWNGFSMVYCPRHSLWLWVSASYFCRRRWDPFVVFCRD